MFRRPSRLLLLAPIAVAAVAILTACTGLDSNDDDLPSPAIFVGDDALACGGGAGSATLTLDAVDVAVIQNDSMPHALGPHRVTISGTVSGLAGGQSAYVLLIDDGTDCPVTSFTEVAAVAGDGSFTATVRMSTTTGVMIERFRLVAVAGPSGAIPRCAASGDCIELDAAGTATNVSGISSSVGVRL